MDDKYLLFSLLSHFQITHCNDMIVQLLLILSIYREGLLRENLSFSITKGCVVLCVLDTLVLVSFCVCEEQRACGVVL